jgi:hypothetical protein
MQEYVFTEFEDGLGDLLRSLIDQRVTALNRVAVGAYSTDLAGGSIFYGPMAKRK